MRLSTTLATLPFVGPALAQSWPVSLTSLGDSFSAGIGAGFYVQPKTDRVNKCKRFDMSHPVLLKEMLPHVEDRNFFFESCSGDVLANIDEQIELLNGNRAQVVTLSISGNDFLFGDVVRACVYNWKAIDDSKRTQCEEALNQADRTIQDGQIWEVYKEKVRTIMDKVFHTRDIGGLNWSVLVITGYPKFFATPVPGDACDTSRFPIPGVIPFPGTAIGQANLMLHTVRERMNELVVKVNDGIRDQIQTMDRERIRFVNIDPLYEGHRFCEPDLDQDVTGANDADIWFISLGTTLNEENFAPNPDLEEDRKWLEWGMQDGEPLLKPNKFKQASVFHPKHTGHIAVAREVKTVVDKWGEDNKHPETQPPMECRDVQGIDAISQKMLFPGLMEHVVDLNGLLGEMRGALCTDKCELPPNLTPANGAAVSKENGGCEISVGMPGGVESYVFRQQTVDSEYCTTTINHIINNCIKNSAKRGFQIGKSPNPTWLEAAVRPLNDPTGRHPQITEPLEEDLSDFKSVCATPGTDSSSSCADKECEQSSWNICQGVNADESKKKFYGCYCARDTKHGSIQPGKPAKDLRCNPDCCASGPLKDDVMVGIWCEANCKTRARQYCQAA